MKSLFLAACVLSAACGPDVPHWEKRCIASHFETTAQYGIGGLPMGGQNFGEYGLQIASESICDRYDSTWVVPDTTPDVQLLKHPVVVK